MTAATATRQNSPAYQAAANRYAAYTAAIDTWREVRATVAAGNLSTFADAAGELSAARAVVQLAFAQWIVAERGLDLMTAQEASGGR